MASDLREDPCCPIDPRWIFAANAQVAVPGSAMKGGARPSPARPGAGGRRPGDRSWPEDDLLVSYATLRQVHSGYVLGWRDTQPR
ncbi:MAG: hypothetical protein JWN00_561 [Actinomycetia bacterium]|nr:hypothetical protein [Actinomycetes bacterium]